MPNINKNLIKGNSQNKHQDQQNTHQLQSTTRPTHQHQYVTSQLTVTSTQYRQLHELPMQQSQQSNHSSQHPQQKYQQKQQGSESQQNNQDILEKIDSLLLQNQAQLSVINADSNLNNDRQKKNNGQFNSSKFQQRELLLNFKITQLQKIINNLNSANKRLKTKLEEYEGDDDGHIFNNNNNNNNQKGNKNIDSAKSSNNNILNSSSQSQFNDQLTQMQGEFQQIQHLILQYKQQLAQSEKKWVAIKQQKDQEIETLKSQIISISESKQAIEKELQRLYAENGFLRERNEQLQADVEAITMQLEDKKQQLEMYYQQTLPQFQQQQHIHNQQQYQRPYHNSPQSQQPQQQKQNRYIPDTSPLSQKHTPPPTQSMLPSSQQYDDYRFNQRIEQQLQVMIKKLMKQLSSEKKINSKLSLEIKRLNNEVIQLERRIKQKNQINYKLQMRLIQIQKYCYAQNINIGNIIYSGHSNTSGGTVMMSTNKNVPYHSNVGNNSATIKNNIQGNGYTTNRNIQLTPSSRNKNESKYFTSNTTSRTIGVLIHNNNNTKNNNNNNNPNQIDNIEKNNHNINILDSDDVLTSLPVSSTKAKPIKFTNNAIVNSKNMNQQSKLTYIDYQHKNTINSNSNMLIEKNHNRQQQHHQQQSTTDRSLSHTNRQFLTFTLIQLQQGKIKITMKQKIIIISKLIQLYCKKIKTQNYDNLSVEEIQVYNFTEKHPNIVRLRVINSTVSKTDTSTNGHQENEQSLMYNLAFIVESLIKDVETIDRQDLQVDLNLGDIIEDILNKNQEQKIAYFQQLARSLQNSALSLA